VICVRARHPERDRARAAPAIGPQRAAVARGVNRVAKADRDGTGGAGHIQSFEGITIAGIDEAPAELEVPRLPSIGRVQDGAQRSRRPTVLGINKTNLGCIGACRDGLSYPSGAAIGRVQDGAIAADPSFCSAHKTDAGVELRGIVTLPRPGSSAVDRLIDTSFRAHDPPSRGAHEVDADKITE
jgi:hypothetical protein